MRLIVVLCLLAPGIARTATQIERGEVLFHEAGKGCGTCHALKGKGTAVGPNLKEIGRLNPRAIAASIRSTLTQYVQSVKLKAGDKFPAMIAAKDEKVVQAWDLSKAPPELRKLDAAEVDSIRNNEGWKHPPLEAGYTGEQMADIVAYIRYAGSGSRTAVDPADVK